MDVSDHLKNTWEKLLIVNEVTFSRECDDDIQGLLLILQVLSSSVQRFVERCRNAENSLLNLGKERTSLESKCSELNKALVSEKAKKCPLCPDLQFQLASVKEALAEKTKPCTQCPKLHLELKSQKKLFEESKEKWRFAFNKFLESSLFTDEKRNTAFSYVSQMLPLDEDEGASGFDRKTFRQQKAAVDSPKRKSPCFDKELDPGSRKRKSPSVEIGPATEMEPSTSHFLAKNLDKKGRHNEKSKMFSKLSSSKKIQTNKVEAKIKTEGWDECKIIVPETLPSEPICPVVERKNIVIPETLYPEDVERKNIVIPESLYPEDDFVEEIPARHKTPNKQLENKEEEGSPVLSAMKRPAKPSTSVQSKEPEVKSEGMEPVDNEPTSPSIVHPKSPSVLAIEGDTSVLPHTDTKDLKLLNEFFDELDKNTAGNLRRSKNFGKNKAKTAIIDKSKTSSTDQSKTKTDVLSPQMKIALGEKNIWALQKPLGFEDKKTEEKICPKKMKQTTLAVVAIPKNQDVSHNDSFNGGVLGEVMNDENFDSDDSECLILPSPKNESKSHSLSSSKCGSKTLNTESNFIEQRTGSVASLEETYYFVPPVTSTCLSLSRRNKVDNEEKSEQKSRKGKTNIQNLDSSFDRVPRKTVSPPYRYKEDPVRKKDERQQLPGWDCPDCAKYYAMDIKDGEDPGNHIDKCSRHRCKYKDLNVTVKGFWDPCIPETQPDDQS